MINKRAWIIPVNTAILFGVLCFWSVQKHETFWAVIEIILCMVNVFFAYRWLKMGSPSKS